MRDSRYIRYETFLLRLIRTVVVIVVIVVVVVGTAAAVICFLAVTKLNLNMKLNSFFFSSFSVVFPPSTATFQKYEISCFVVRTCFTTGCSSSANEPTVSD